MSILYINIYLYMKNHDIASEVDIDTFHGPAVDPL